MRQNRFVPPALVAVAIAAAASPLFAQIDGGLSVTNYQLVSEQRVTRSQWYETYQADLLNTGLARTAVTATVSSFFPSLKILPGKATLHFAPVPANGRVTSSDTFTILIDRDLAQDLSQLRWYFLNPVANAGANQTVALGATVHLDGSASSNPTGGFGSLSYKWAFESRPEQSHAFILNDFSPVDASFVVDVPGNFVVSLTVRNGLGMDTTRMIATTGNSAPVAKAGPNQTVPLGADVTLNGGGSSDVDGDSLTYVWTMVSQPSGSKAVIAAFRGVIAFSTADVAGTYVAQLVVNDGLVDSAPSLITITAGGAANTPPVANAGIAQAVNAGAEVHLSGAGSTDVDGDPLTYHWLLINAPDHSGAQLSSLTAVNPTFTPDLPGAYIVQLIVNDGKIDSDPATVVITASTQTTGTPSANAGHNQTVQHGASVTLDGSATDPQDLPLTYKWYLISTPPGSTAALSDAGILNPTFVADKPGAYVAQLVVNNGKLSSAPSTVIVTTQNTAPVANAGPNQVVAAGFVATLDGGKSSDADNDPLAYSWSVTSAPAGSAVILSAAASKTPTFLPDLQGEYVFQLIVNDGFTSSVPVTVTVTAVGTKITLSPDPLKLSNTPVTLSIFINPAAGPSGVKVTFFGFDPSVISIPANITIPANATSIELPIAPLAAGNTYLYAAATGYQAGMTSVTVTVPDISVTLAAQGVGVGRSIGGTVHLSAPAPPGGVGVVLVSTGGGLVFFEPSIVKIGPGESTASFSAIGVAPGNAIVSGLAPGYENGAPATVLVVAKLGTIQISPQNVTVEEGSSITIDVKISAPAPAGGVIINLVSSDTSTAQVSSAVFIRQGALAPEAPAQVLGVAAGTTIISATAQNYTATGQTVTVTAPPVANTTPETGGGNPAS